ncbi:hypothetical protein LXL04_019724 [Taraxacum kok-saghyz]
MRVHRRRFLYCSKPSTPVEFLLHLRRFLAPDYSLKSETKLYCDTYNKFLVDRLVEGSCPTPEFDTDNCPKDCTRPCEKICPANAIFKAGVITERCYCCGRCFLTNSQTSLSVQNVVQLMSHTTTYDCSAAQQHLQYSPVVPLDESRQDTRSRNTITHSQTKRENKAIKNTRILRGSDSVQILHPRAATRIYINSHRLQVGNKYYTQYLVNVLGKGVSNLKNNQVFQASSSQEQAKLSPISLIAAAPHYQLLEGPVEAPTSFNSAVANPTTDSYSVSTGLDTPPDPEIHRGPLTLSQLCKHST